MNNCRSRCVFLVATLMASGALMLNTPQTGVARPYYAAQKGLSCAACHVAPAGGGMRIPRPESIGTINDFLAMGADVRGYWSRTQNTNASSFTLGRSAAYVAVEPRPDLDLVGDYHLD